MPEYWEGKHYAFFQNRECEFFPCHKGAEPENFNCLFCYCPLYALGKKCGGNCSFTESGKDFSGCIVPLRSENYGSIVARFGELCEMIKE